VKQHRILIVGAGPAGLALARALAQAGFAPELIERQASWGVAGTGMYLPANGVRALRALAWRPPWPPGRPRFPISGCSTTADACSPTSTSTGSGATSAPAWP
jgi:2-polyprenyl-6-methoxyphenol hydroxylase-like FAD-dependent oxidoreductase